VVAFTGHVLRGNAYLDGLLDVIDKVRPAITDSPEQSADVGGGLYRAGDQERRVDAELAGAFP
jgi:hypothetical protein